MAIRRVLAFLFVWVSSLAYGAGDDLQLVHVLRPKSDIQMKIEAVLNVPAGGSIDVLTYHHDTTPSSFLFLEALRMAALKGVEVRYLYDEIASSRGVQTYSDAYWSILKTAGVKVRAIDLRSRLTKWGPFNMVHSKMILADSGDGQHKVAILGGRNFGDRYVNWIDNSFTLRMKNGSDQAFEMLDYMNRVWSQVHDKVTSFAGKPPENIVANEAELRREMHLHFGTERSISETADFMNFVKTGQAKLLPVFNFKSSQVSVVGSNLSDRVAGRERVDTIDQALKDLLKNSKVVDVSTILAALTDDKRAMFEEFLKKGGALGFISNDPETFKSVFENKDSIMTKTLGKMQEQDFLKLSKHGLVMVHTLKPNQEFTFHHAKHVVGNGGVLLVSSNNNYSSDVHAEENGLYVKSPEFTRYMIKYNDGLKNEFFREYDYENGKKLNVVERSCSLILRSVF